MGAEALSEDLVEPEPAIPKLLDHSFLFNDHYESVKVAGENRKLTPMSGVCFLEISRN